MNPKRRPLALTRAVLSSVLVTVALTGCKTRPQTSRHSVSQLALGKPDLAALDAGAIVISSTTNLVEISADPPNRQVEPIGEGAADATRNFLNTPNLGNPQLEAAVGAVQFALGPFAAAYGAISASQKRLSPDEAIQSQLDLTQNMRSNATPQVLIEKVEEIARQKTRRLLICANCDSNPPPAQVPVSARLEIAVSEMRLKALKSGGNQYALSIGASARLIRASDGKVLLAKTYLYESGGDLYIDWTRHRGLEDVANTGYQVLAGQIADDVFQPASQTPILIGPGNKQVHESWLRVPATKGWPARKREARAFKRHGLKKSPCFLTARRPGISHLPLEMRSMRVRQLGRSGFSEAATFQFVGQLQLDTGSMEIHTGKMDDRIRVPAQTTEPGSASGGMSDTKWSLDGMEQDRNAVVQGVACVAAVPFGLWEQTFGIVHNHSVEKKEELCRTLNTVTTRQHIEGDLADEVARRLQSKATDPIRRTEEPMRFAFANVKTEEKSTPSNGLAQCKTALEIQIVGTRLVGKHRNSSSRAMVVDVQATVFRTSDGQELYSRPIRYTSAARKLKTWTADDARLFRRELGECSKQTAQALVNDLLSEGFVTPVQTGPPAIRFQQK